MTHPHSGSFFACARYLIGVACMTMAASVYGAPLDDPNNVGWTSIRGYSSDEYSKYFKKRADGGYLQIDIEVDRIGGKTVYSGVWQKNTDKRKWSSRRDMTHDEFNKRWEDLRKKGYRLIDQEAYRIGNKNRYAGIWVENKEKLKWGSSRNLSSKAFSKKFKEYDEKGYRIVDIEAYKQGNSMKYAGIWVKNDAKLGWSMRRNMSASEYGKRFKDMSDKGYRVADIESYRDGSKQKYSAIWVKNKNKRRWAAYRDMDGTGFSNRWRGLKDEGYRLVDFEAYKGKGGTRYAGVWRQNGSKLSWPHKSAVDKAARDYRKDNGIPGISVAVTENGKIVYSRGFGYADVKNEKAAHAGTIFRLASVSKPLTALIAMRQADKNQLELDDRTRKHASYLPKHHTHTIRQLVNHRSGVRHYKGSDRSDDCIVPDRKKWKDSSKKKYKTAKDASKLIRKDPLMYEPDDRRCYSTHAYTLLAAALEGAGKKSFTSLVSNELSKPFKLGTLATEDVDKNRSERSKIYSSKSKETKRDVLNWKYAGGGMEASIVDMAVLGMRVIENKVVDESTRDEFWGGSSFSHDGSQTGGRSYWRLYFDDNKVITVLSNRRSGDPQDLVNAIADIIN